MRSIYPSFLDPTIYPDYQRRHVKVPTWKTFDNLPQFKILRRFNEKKGILLDIQEQLDTYVDRFKLGRVVQPHSYTVWAKNFDELVKEINKRNLYLFDIWSYKPGCLRNGTLSNWLAPEGMPASLEKMLGDHFLAFSNSEQDGRYIGAYASQQCPSPSDRFHQYLNFQRHFQRLCNQLGNHMTTLVSLCFGHFFLKEGNHILIGAETAQALPNCQVYYSFIRGAGKQYGIHWYGVASIWNRWGYKAYFSEPDAPEYGTMGGYRFGPKCGTSLSLLKRLIYTHYMYNCVLLGFETSWFKGPAPGIGKQKALSDHSTSRQTLSPIGELQAATVRFTEKHGRPGVMHTPVALLLDHFSGWAMARHYYSNKIFQVWGMLPYKAGDYLTHSIFSMLYPGYEDSGFYHDESGFLSPTPFGDITDSLLSDTPAWVMMQYSLIIAGGTLNVDDELRDKINSYVEEGGHFVTTAENAEKIWPEWDIGKERSFPAGNIIRFQDGSCVKEKHRFTLRSFSETRGSEIIAVTGQSPAIVRIKRGKGKISLFLSPYGLNQKALVKGPIKNDIDKPLSCPFHLLEHVKRMLSELLEKEQIFSAGSGLSYVACRKAKGSYTLAITNNHLSERQYRIVSHCGKITGIKEITLEQSEKGEIGYWPEGKENDKCGKSDNSTIAGGDIRLFRINIQEKNLRTIKPMKPQAPVQNRILAHHDISDVKETILQWPTFFQHFDGMKLTWRYLHIRDMNQIKREYQWFERQPLRIFVDFSSGCNLFPDFAFIDLPGIQYRETLNILRELFTKMKAIGAREAVFSLHRTIHRVQTKKMHEKFVSGVRALCRLAAKHKINIHLQHHRDKWPGDANQMITFINEIKKDNLFFALNTAHVIQSGETFSKIIGRARKRLGSILLSAHQVDSFGQRTDTHIPIHSAEPDISSVQGARVPLIFDAVYENWNEIYRDIEFMKRKPGQ